MTAIHRAARAHVDAVVKLSALGASDHSKLPIGSLDEARERMGEGSRALAAHQRAGGKTAMVHDTVRQILGRPPRSFAEFAKDHAAIFRRGSDEQASR